MSFICAFCTLPQPSGVKPIKRTFDVDRVTVSYVNELPVLDREGKPTRKSVEKTSTGFEFTHWWNSCAECAGLPAVAVASKVIPSDPRIPGMHAYARKSNKRIDEDQVMQAMLETYKSIAPLSLAIGLEEPQVPAPKWHLAHALVGSLLRRAEEKEKGSKRAAADFAAGYGVLKAYEQAGGAL